MVINVTQARWRAPNQWGVQYSANIPQQIALQARTLLSPGFPRGRLSLGALEYAKFNQVTEKEAISYTPALPSIMANETRVPVCSAAGRNCLPFCLATHPSKRHPRMHLEGFLKESPTSNKNLKCFSVRYLMLC